MLFSSGLGKFPRTLLAAGGLALMASASPLAISAQAQNVWTGNTSDDWADGSNWSASVPPDASTITVINGDGIYSPQISGTNGSQTGSFYIGSTIIGGGTGNGNFTLTGNGSFYTLHSAGDVTIGEGQGAIGHVTMTGATWTINDWLRLGVAGGNGTLVLNNIPSGDSSNLDSSGAIIGDGTGSSGTLVINDSYISMYSGLGVLNTIGTNGGTGSLTVYSSERSYGISYFSVNGSAMWGDGPGSHASITADGGRIDIYDYDPPSGFSLSAGTNSGTAEINLIATGKTTQTMSNLMTQSMLLGSSGGTGILNLSDDAGAQIQRHAVFGQGAGSTATVNIASGSILIIGNMAYGTSEIPTIGMNGGTGTVNISGIGAFGRPSGLDIENGLNLGMGTGGTGTINVIGSGKLNTLTGSPGTYPEERFIRLGVDGGTGNVNISGTDAFWYIGSDPYGQTKDDPVTYPPADLYIGYSGTGNVTIANGGTVSVGWSQRGQVSDPIAPSYYDTVTDYGSDGTVFIASQAGSKGSLTIGASPGSTPQASGTLLAAGIEFGAGNGFLNFDITDTDYQFTVPVSGHGTIANYAGTTWLAADNSGFSGATNLYGGTLGLENDNSIGSSLVSALGNAMLAYNDGVTIANAINITGGNTLTTSVADTFSAIQNGQIYGSGNLTKAGDGTLELTAQNTYTGLTTVSEGVLALTGTGSVSQSAAVIADSVFDISGVTSGSSSIKSLGGGGDVLLGSNDLVLTAANHTFSGVISGNGGLQVTGGTETLSGANSYLGDTVISNGILRAGATDTFSAASNYTVNAGGALELNGHNQTIASLVNAGTVRTSGDPGIILTVTGNYTGNGGLLVLDTVLGADDSDTDRLVVNGTASGSTRVQINNFHGGGAQTTGNGIMVVQINGTGSTGSFTQAGRIAAGAYEYSLFQNGINADADDGNWYLRSTGIRPELPLAATIIPVATEYGYAMLGTLNERYSENYVAPAQPVYENRTIRDKNGKEHTVKVLADSRPSNVKWFSGAWGRIIGDRGFQKNGGDLLSRGPSYSYNFGGIQTGLDIFGQENASGTDRAGIYVGYGNISATAKGADGAKAGSVNMDAYTLGAYWTHRASQGWYTDAVAQGTWYSADATSVYGQKLKPSGFSFTASLEGGYSFDLGNGATFEPQVQLAYQNTSFDNTADAYGRFDLGDGESLRGRIGARLTKTWNTGTESDPRTISLWGRANIWHEFRGNGTTTATGPSGANPFTIPSSLGGTWGEVAVGLSAQTSKNVSLFATTSYSQSLDNKGREAWSGRLGATVRW